jgi:hypothetical protein
LSEKISASSRPKGRDDASFGCLRAGDAKLATIEYLFASIASNDFALKFSKISLNNNNFFNSFKKYKMNTNKLDLIHTLIQIYTKTHSLSSSYLNQKLFYSILQCNQNKLGFLLLNTAIFLSHITNVTVSFFYQLLMQGNNRRIIYGFIVNLAIIFIALQGIENIVYSFTIYDSVCVSCFYFVTNLEDIKSKILPFFEKFPLQGNKLKDFLDFKKAVELKKSNRVRLTTENLANIKEIKRGMNQNRISDNDKNPLNSNPLTRARSIKSNGSNNKRHYSSSAQINKKQSKSEQIKFFE